MESAFEAVAEHALTSKDFALPGFAIHAQIRGQTFQKSWGCVRDDTIYRWFSNSKVVTSAAALLLAERGLLRAHTVRATRTEAAAEHCRKRVR